VSRIEVEWIEKKPIENKRLLHIVERLPFLANGAEYIFILLCLKYKFLLLQSLKRLKVNLASNEQNTNCSYRAGTTQSNVIKRFEASFFFYLYPSSYAKINFIIWIRCRASISYLT